MTGPDDDLERLFRLEYSPAQPAPVDTWSSPRHSTDDIATETAPAGAAVAGQLARSRELHGGWRWSAEQKRLKALLQAQERIGAELDQLQHVGARVLHARRAPDSAQPIDHIVIARRGVFVVADVLTTPDQPVAWQPDGHLATAGLSMRLFEESLVAASRAGLGTAEQMLGERWRVPVLAVIAVAGPWAGPSAGTTDGVSVCQVGQLRAVADGPYTPALFDGVDIAVIADAVARAFPSAV